MSRILLEDIPKNLTEAVSLEETGKLGREDGLFFTVYSFRTFCFFCIAYMY